MKKVTVFLLLGGFVVGWLSANLTHRPSEPAKPAASPNAALVVGEWAISIPQEATTEHPARGYMIGELPNLGGQGLILLDSPVAEIQDDLGPTVLSQAKHCLEYYPGIWRLATGSQTTTYTRRIGSHYFSVLTPQSSCQTAADDHSLDEFNSHVIDDLDFRSIVQRVY